MKKNDTGWPPRLSKPIDIELHIKKEIRSFFEKDIYIQTRLLQIFHYRTKGSAFLPPYGLWAAALKIMPQLSCFLDTVGILIDKIDWDGWPSLEKIEPDYLTSWYSSLSTYLKTHHWDGEKLPIVDSIIKRGELGVIDCLIGTLLAHGSTGGDLNSANHFLYSAYSGLSDSEIFKSPNCLDAIKFSYNVAAKLSNWISPDPSGGDQQFIVYHDGAKIRLRPFAVFKNFQLDKAPLPDGGLWIARGNILQPDSIFTADALSLLEDLINSNAKEVEFQKFFEKHPEFLLSIGNYKGLHPQLVLHEDSGGTLIPDFFLEKINSDFCDICDLKRPTAKLIRNQKNRLRFRDIVREGIAQLEHYKSWFDDKSNRNAFYSRYGLKAFRPRIVLIIGRRDAYYNEVDRIKLESSLPNSVSLFTYDDILDKVQQWKHLTHIS